MAAVLEARSPAGLDAEVSPVTAVDDSSLTTVSTSAPSRGPDVVALDAEGVRVLSERHNALVVESRRVLRAVRAVSAAACLRTVCPDFDVVCSL
jgi:hypothetical protein